MRGMALIVKFRVTFFIRKISFGISWTLRKSLIAALTNSKLSGFVYEWKQIRN